MYRSHVGFVLLLGFLVLSGCDSSSNDGTKTFRLSVKTSDGTPKQGLEVGIRPCVDADGRDVCTFEQFMQASSRKTGGVTARKAVELASFDANYLQSDDKVELRWTTLSEVNNTGFRVEERADGETFSEVGFVDGAGTTSETKSYIFRTDAPIRSGNVDYRLVEIGVDGYESESRVETVTIVVPTFDLRALFPNPAADHVNVLLSLPTEASLEVSIETFHGETLDTILSPEAPRDAGRYQFVWQPSPELPDGVYAVNVEAEYETRASDDTTHILVIMRPDPVVQSLGRTDGDGTVSLTTSAFLGQLGWEGAADVRNSNGTVVAQMAASRRILIEVTDPETGQTQTFERDAPQAGGKIDLTWSPPAATR
jgi:hypothetical protein